MKAELRSHLIDWAQARGIVAIVDEVGNLILKQPASLGCEAMPGVILQAHLDMVCQANAGTAHDFERDPINAQLLDGWVVAKHTTLGADNGVGVALALAVLEEPGLAHPALEVLLTINEESGMDGARGLMLGALDGKQLINLDSEDWGYFYLGCAGGVDVEVRQDCEQEEVPPDYAILRFDVSGLRGGHSGLEIHLGRGNAIKLLAEALRDLSAHTELRLIEIQGGTARNAIPREAFAVCAIPVAAVSGIHEWLEHRLAAWRQRFAGVDAKIAFNYELDEMPVGKAIQLSGRDRVLAFLDVVTNGVVHMNDDFPDVTDTSCNLGVLALAQGVLKVTFKVRSLHDDRADTLADKLISFAASYQLRGYKYGAYPAWTPNPSSKLLGLCQQVYLRQFAQPAGLQVIHAGLECGLFAASHPHLDMISFGPDIRGAHAPGEKVEVESVARCWTLLKALLQELGKA